MVYVSTVQRIHFFHGYQVFIMHEEHKKNLITVAAISINSLLNLTSEFIYDLIKVAVELFKLDT